MADEEKPNSINRPLLNADNHHLKPKAKRSLVSRSGKQFESVDHYISESIVQNYYPKKDKEDLELIKNVDESPIMTQDEEPIKSFFIIFLILTIFLFFILFFSKEHGFKGLVDP